MLDSEDIIRITNEVVTGKSSDNDDAEQAGFRKQVTQDVSAMRLAHSMEPGFHIASPTEVPSMQPSAAPTQQRSEWRWKGGYPQELVDWYNAGADGGITWGEDGDWEACVAIAGKYIDNPQGFCTERHIDATGAAPGHAPGESEDKSHKHGGETRFVNGATSRSASVASKFIAPLIAAYHSASAPAIAKVLTAVYAASYVTGLRSAAAGKGGAAITAGIQNDDTLAPLLENAVAPDVTAGTAPSGLATLLNAVESTAGNIVAYMNTSGAPAVDDQATQMATTESAAGAEAGAQDAASAGGFDQMRSVPDSADPCDVCEDAANNPYDIGDEGPPWHPNCGCESEPYGAGDNTNGTETTSALGRNVRRWIKRDWQEWDLQHPYVPKGATASTHVQPITPENARGNSRPVTTDAFKQLVATGQARIAELQADTRPGGNAAFNDPAQWQSVKDSAFAEVSKPWGGQTIDPGTGAAIEPEHGYAVSIKSPDTLQVSVPEDATQEEFNKAMDTAKETYGDQIQGSSTYLGVFHDDDEKLINIDPVAHVQTTSDVDSIGAASHAVGGAYDFASGNGHFPPHVNDLAAAVEAFNKPNAAESYGNIESNVISDWKKDPMASINHAVAGRSRR